MVTTIDSNYLAYYVKTIQLLAIWLKADVIEQVLAEYHWAKFPLKTRSGVCNKQEVSGTSNGIDIEVIQEVLFFRDMSDKLFGKYGHPHRKFRKPGKGMTEEMCREWYARRISDITLIEYQKIQNILSTRDKVELDMLMKYAYLPLLSDTMQAMIEEEMMKDTINTIVSLVDADKTEVEMTLYYEGLLKEYCGAPQHL